MNILGTFLQNQRQYSFTSRIFRNMQSSNSRTTRKTKIPLAKGGRNLRTGDTYGYTKKNTASSSSQKDSSFMDKDYKSTSLRGRPSSRHAQNSRDNQRQENKSSTYQSGKLKSGLKKYLHKLSPSEQEYTDYSESENQEDTSIDDYDDGNEYEEDDISSEDEDSYSNSPSSERIKPTRMTARQRMIIQGTSEKSSDRLNESKESSQPLQKKTVKTKSNYRPRIERTQPPEEVAKEVEQIISILIAENALSKSEKKPELVEKPLEPDYIRESSNPQGNYVIIPRSKYSEIFSAATGWEEPVKADTTKDIEQVYLNRIVINRC